MDGAKAMAKTPENPDRRRGSGWVVLAAFLVMMAIALGLGVRLAA